MQETYFLEGFKLPATIWSSSIHGSLSELKMHIILIPISVFCLWPQGGECNYGDHRQSSLWGSSGSRVTRYAEYDPPIILPDKKEQIVKAASNYTLTCEGSRGVNWRIPGDSKSDLRTRLSIVNRQTTSQVRPNTATVYVAELRLTRLKFTDTGTFTCTYNGTTDITSIDNSTKVALMIGILDQWFWISWICSLFGRGIRCGSLKVNENSTILLTIQF